LTQKKKMKFFSQTFLKLKQATINISKEDMKFSAGHFTIFSETHRESLHGHNFKVSMNITGEVDSNGMINNYQIFKTKLRNICKEFDEKFLLPKFSKFLQIQELNDEVLIKFRNEEMKFPKNDTMILPLTNITGEELSFLIANQMKEELKNENISKINISVSSGDGQSVSSSIDVEKNISNSKFIPSGESDEKFLVITGGSSGIGKETIKRFQSKGYKAINISRRICDLPEVQNIQMDLSSMNDPSTLNLDINGKICFVHSSGSHPSDSIQDVSMETMNSTFNVNVTSAAVLTSYLLPKMSRGSSVIYIGSTLSEKAVKNRLSYVASKHAIIGLMRAVTQDLHGKGIHAACICPGFTDTEMLNEASSIESFQNFIKEFVSFGRLISPDEMAKLIFETSENAILNGSVIHANLGQRES
jgi:3-oxoacyl-[acyl-carrier protein] reductase